VNVSDCSGIVHINHIILVLFKHYIGLSARVIRPSKRLEGGSGRSRNVSMCESVYVCVCVCVCVCGGGGGLVTAEYMLT
jgi:hypothetical protein